MVSIIKEDIEKKSIGHQTMINVDPTRRTSFSTIQSAIDSVPSNNKDWIFISVKAGIYNEQVKIPPDKPFIYLKGEGIGKTNVVWGAHDTMLTSSTFASMADNIVVSGITFVDTLLDDKGRHFFKLCTIEGAIDFIFGGGQSIYEQCTISVNVGELKPGSTGYIAAQARASPKDGGGFIFKQCNVTGKERYSWEELGKLIPELFITILFSQTLLFLKDGMLGLMMAMIFLNQLLVVLTRSEITFAEDKCQGRGSDKSKRVKWEKNLNPQDLHLFISNSYIDTDGWTHKLPLNMLD
ncbi:hypothetical protein DH2020_027736 [Rehmannia glutinosa]|uniref:Pectinesterase n=1 Tax=Rehmannia glutinosa TaxID=99300 RepID=A0ABR0VTB6_REHGL